MAQKTNLSPDQQKQVAVERMWLRYYNDTLLSKGLITETQHHKMAAKIACRTTPLPPMQS